MRKYNVNEFYFETIDTFDKAYWLGFLMADGSVDNLGSIRLEISTKDVEHVQKFKNVLDSEHPIVLTAKNCCSIRIGSKIMLGHLCAHGVIPNKTFRTQTPKISDFLLSHFYRGVFDGDGWFTHRTYKSGRRCFDIGFANWSMDFLQEIRLFVQNQIVTTKGSLIRINRGNHAVCQLAFGGNRLFERITNLLYENSNPEIRLDRKYLKYESYMKDIDYYKTLPHHNCKN